jgi:hypothetical protein
MGFWQDIFSLNCNFHPLLTWKQSWAQKNKDIFRCQPTFRHFLSSLKNKDCTLNFFFLTPNILFLWTGQPLPIVSGSALIIDIFLESDMWVHVAWKFSFMLSVIRPNCSVNYELEFHFHFIGLFHATEENTKKNSKIYTLIDNWTNLVNSPHISC